MTATATALARFEPFADEMDGIVEQAIVSFLNSETNGEELFQALYGAPLDEPIPERMLALVRSARPA
jgi:hypothetical protein